MPRLAEDRWVTAKGDMADEIAWAVYGARSDGLIALLEANPGLAKQPPMLPAGLIIILPRLAGATPPARPMIRIFS